MTRNFRILFLVVMTTLLASGICRADGSVDALKDQATEPKEPEYKLKLRTSRILIHLAALPAYAWAEDIFHEGSHALWAAAEGHQIKTFKPYPHFEEYDGKKFFLFGSMSFEGALTRKEEALMLAGPTMTDFALFTATDLALTYGVDPNSWYAPILFMAGCSGRPTPGARTRTLSGSAKTPGRTGSPSRSSGTRWPPWPSGASCTTGRTSSW